MSPPQGAVLGFYDGVAEEGLWGHPSPSSSSRVQGGVPAEIKYSAFLLSKYTIGRFCGIWEHLKVENALFCDWGGCTIYYIWEANLCVWGLSPMPTPAVRTPLWKI